MGTLISYSRFQSLVLTLVLVVLFCAHCKPKTIQLKSPPHYSFRDGYAYKLEPAIVEISGIVWDTKVDEFIAHNDEAGKIFLLDKATCLIKKTYSLGLGKGDYEDIVLANGEIYMLNSDATISKIVKDSSNPDKWAGAEIGKLDLEGTNDFESMYFDSSRNAIVIICKNCEMDKGKKRVSAFAFYPDSIGFNKEPIFNINTEEVEKLAPKETTRLEPSAAAVHPVLKKLFIVSSGSGELVITDLNGKVEGTYILSKKMFPQPEGITFKNNGDMYISNEGVTSKATLVRFIYKP